MIYLLDFLIVIALASIALQDFKQRKISWVILPVLFIISVVSGILLNDIGGLTNSFLINLGFMTVQMLCITVYFSIKNHSFTNIINKYIGIGDLLFFAVICVVFSPVNFIFFYLGSLVVITVGSVVYITLKKNKNKDIPFAGSMAVILIFCFVFKNIYHTVNFYDDNMSLGLLNSYLWTI